MRYILRVISVITLVLVLSACVTDRYMSKAVADLEAKWKVENDRIIEREGHRFFNKTKKQGFMAAQLSVGRLGMVVEDQSYETGYLLVTGPAPIPLTKSEWERVQKSESPEMRKVLAKKLGIYSWWAELEPTGKEVLVNIFVSEKDDGIEVTVGLRLRVKESTTDKLRRMQPPPTAIRIGLRKFWSEFEKELGTGAARADILPATKAVILPKIDRTEDTPLGYNPDGIAVIIGNKNYAGRVPPVDFAHNDAEAMKRFVVEMLGVHKDNIVDLRDVTLAEMEDVLGNYRTHRAKLWQWVRPHESDVFVFYSGHGVPGLKDGREYLLPVDGNPNAAEIKGYPVELLYKNLEKLEARSLTVFMDACFSGESPHGPLIRDTSGIRVVPKKGPAVLFTVISSSRKDQSASWDKEAQHGLFTKYILEALYGAADGKRYGNSDKRITLTEIKAYLDREMTYAARRHYGREQQAMVSGDPEKVIVVLGK